MSSVLLLILALCAVSLCQYDLPKATKKPVIIDTDIGSFIDDTFAIVYAIQSEELDVKLIITCSGNTTDRAKVLARLLRLIGRDDIPIGIGVFNKNVTDTTLFDLAEKEDLDQYKGGVFIDGVKEMGNIIMNSKEIVDIIAIGPMTNFPSLLDSFPDSVNRSTIKLMAGSIHKGYNDSNIPSAEYNVILCMSCMRRVLESGWKITVTPLDTCGTIVLGGKEGMSEILQAENKASLVLSSSLMYYCIHSDRIVCNLRSKTPILFDVVAVLMSLPEEGSPATRLLEYQSLNLVVNGTGFTVVDNNHGVPVNVALYWNDNYGKSRFIDSLASILAKIT